MKAYRLFKYFAYKVLSQFDHYSIKYIVLPPLRIDEIKCRISLVQNKIDVVDNFFDEEDVTNWDFKKIYPRGK